MDIGSILEAAIKGGPDDLEARLQAEAQLVDAYKNHYMEYLGALTQALSETDRKPEVRMLAALAIKNSLTSKDLETKTAQMQQWLNLDSQVASQIKEVTLSCLKTEDERVASAVAQTVAAIAEIELPHGRWPFLMAHLVDNTKPEQPSNVKKASLLSIGYICETADRNNAGVVSQASGILTAIVQGAQSSEPDEKVRLAAINALGDSLDFIRDNFQREGERNYIMTVVCEATQAQSPLLKAAAYGSMARIMSMYYQYMEVYMKQALFGVTVKQGMQDPDDKVACMAVEFWSTVCEEEIDREIYEPSHNFHFSKIAAPQVLPILLELLTRQDEYADEDEWNVSMAAGACLQLFAQNIGNDVVPQTLKFVEQNIVNTESWRHREAAVMAFGSILDGPEAAHLAELIKQALEPILHLMNDSSLHVKDTVAWCLGRMADLVIDGIDVTVHLPVIMQTLIKGLQDHPKVSTNCCWTIMNIVEQHGADGVHSETTVVSQYYPQLMPALLLAASRSDNEHSARTSAYEALSYLAIFAAEDCIPAIIELSAEVLNRLEATLTMQQHIVGLDDRTNLEELQISLLGLLTNIIRRVHKQVIPASGRLMTLFLNLLQNKLPNSLIEEDIFIAIGAVAIPVEGEFNQFMEALSPFLLNALSDPSLQICSTAVGLVADIANALGEGVNLYSDQYMELFFKNLRNESARRDIKPAILSCFGDIASSTGPKFERYLVYVFQVLEQAALLQQDSNSTYEYQEYVLQLRESIVDAYVGIVAGLRDTPHLFANYVPTLFNFLRNIQSDLVLIQTQSVARSTVGLIGDVATMYPKGEFKHFYAEPWVLDIIRKTRQNPQFSAETQTTARWTREQQKRQLAL